MAINKAKRCPFCNGEGKIWTRMSFDRRMHCSIERTTVLCDDCGCRTQAYTNAGDALAAWNRRSAKPCVGKANVKSPWFIRPLEWLMRPMGR